MGSKTIPNATITGEMPMPSVVPIGCYEFERDRAARAEAELAEAMTAVGLTGYDHREDVSTPAQAIYALWADHQKLRAELAAAREREAALAAAISPVKLTGDIADVIFRVRRAARAPLVPFACHRNECGQCAHPATPCDCGYEIAMSALHEERALAALDAEEKKA